MRPLHLAGVDDADRVLSLVGAFHTESGFKTDDIGRAEAVAPLLDGSPHGALWLIGPRRAPVGYIAVSFGWSIEFGGLDAMVDELYIRPAVRGRGMGGEAIDALARSLRDASVKALHLETDRTDKRINGFYKRARFSAREGSILMSRIL